MNKEDLLSKKLAEVEERKKHNLARRVESSDRETAGSVGVDASTVPLDETVSLPTGVLVHDAPVGEGSPHTMGTDDDHPDGVVCIRIECAQDRRYWAEVREEELRCVPRPPEHEKELGRHTTMSP